MKSFLPAALFFLLAPCVPAADVDPAKTAETSAESRTKEEYDEEARIRISGFTLPEGIEASLFADAGQTRNPSAICFDHAGRLYVAEIHRWRAGVQDIRNEQQILLDDIDNRTSQDRLEMYQRDQVTRPLSFYEEFEDRIVVIADGDGDGRADSSSVWADGFNDVLDGPGIGLVAGHDDTIYYTNIPHLWRLRDTDGDGKADERESLQDGFGVRMSISGHDMHGVVWGPDGKLYWSIGDRGYHLTTKEGRFYHRPFQGAVFRCNPDGTELEEVYTGLRNPQELAFDQFGNLFTCDNDADQWDTGRLVYILEGGDSGWNHGHQVLLNFRSQLELRTPLYEHPDHKEIPMNPWMTEGLWENLHEGRPAFALPPVDLVSWGPSGLVYNYGATAMPERYDNHFWVCNFGGAKGDLEAFSVKESGAGFALDRHEVFMVGLGNTDVEFGPDGRMYLSCFNNNGWYKQDIGNVYALAASDTGRSDLIARTATILTTDFSTLVESEVAPLLGHPDMRVRLRAQFDLATRGAAGVFLEALAQTENRLLRLHGLWGLGQLARREESLLRTHIEALSDEDTEIRAHAAKILGDSRSASAAEPLLAALDDDSARVRSFAAIAIGKCGDGTALPKLLELLAANDDEDVFLRHALVQGLWGLNEREKMLKETKNESAAVRLGILLALRKLEDPRVKYFLDDEEESIRFEAIRAINDLDLVTALPDLAARLDLYSSASGEIRMPEDHRDWIIQSRLINANFRVGRPGNATRLLAYAAQPALPALLREQALLALLEWSNPGPVDPTTGRHRPLDPASRGDITAAVHEGIPSVFESAEGPLVALATKLALEHGAEAPVDLLISQVTDEKAQLAARLGSLEGLARQAPDSLAPLWDSLLQSESAPFRAGTIAQLLQSDAERALAETVKMAASERLRERQLAYGLLARLENGKADGLILERLKALDSEIPGARLDLLEAAEARRDSLPAIAEQLAAYQAALDPADPLAPFEVALTGGHPEKGRELFLTHAAGQCSKCHKVDGDGGVAGPELTGIGSRQDARYLLASLVAPSEVVVPGYGMTVMTLKNGETIGGALLSEDEKTVTLRIPDPGDSAKQIEKEYPLSDIATRQPPISAMPPMGLIMKKTEVRDLVAFLASLEEKKGKKGH